VVLMKLFTVRLLSLFSRRNLRTWSGPPMFVLVLLLGTASCTAVESAPEEPVPDPTASDVPEPTAARRSHWVPLDGTNPLIEHTIGVTVHKLDDEFPSAKWVKQLAPLGLSRWGEVSTEQFVLLDTNWVVRVFRPSETRDGYRYSRVVENAKRVEVAASGESFCVWMHDGSIRFYPRANRFHGSMKWDFIVRLSNETLASPACFDWTGPDLVTWDGSEIKVWDPHTGEVTLHAQLMDNSGETWTPVALDAEAKVAVAGNPATNELRVFDYSGDDVQERAGQSPFNLEGTYRASARVWVKADTNPRQIGSGTFGFDAWRPTHGFTSKRVDIVQPMPYFQVVDETGEVRRNPHPALNFLNFSASPRGHYLLCVQDYSTVWLIDLKNGRRTFRCILPGWVNWRRAVIGAFMPNLPTFYVLTDRGELYRFDYAKDYEFFGH